MSDKKSPLISPGDSGRSSGVPSHICVSPRPCGFRGKTIDILGILSSSGGMTVREIADRIGLKYPDCWNYLRRGEKKGVFERKESWGWIATSYGLLILEIKSHNNNNKIDTNSKQTRNKLDTNSTLSLDSSVKQIQYKQQLLEIYNSLDSCAQKLWDLHIHNYNKTGSQTFVIPLEIKEGIKNIESTLYGPVKKVAVKEMSPTPWLLRNGFTEAEAQVFWNALEKLNDEELITYRKGKNRVTLRIYNHRIRALKGMAKYA